MALHPCANPNCRHLALRGHPRCKSCEQAWQQARNARRVHYHGDYRSRATEIVRAANNDPATVCWRCGQPARPLDPWQAGHLIDSHPDSPLAAEHRSCNARAGGGSKGR